MRVVGVIAAVGLCLLLTGCSTRMEAVIAGPLHAPMVTFLTLDGEPQEVCMDQLQVWRDREVIWSVRVAEGDCGLLTSVTFGTAPQGFVGSPPGQALESGVTYQVFGQGWGQGVPWGGGGAYVFENGAWRDVEGMPSEAE